MISEAAGARYPFAASSPPLLFNSYSHALTRDLQATLHQGAIERILAGPLLEAGVTVDRPIRPTSISLSTDIKELNDPTKHSIKV